MTAVSGKDIGVLTAKIAVIKLNGKNEIVT